MGEREKEREEWETCFMYMEGAQLLSVFAKKKKKVFTDTTSICTDRTHCINTLYKPTTHSIKVTLPVAQETN